MNKFEALIACRNHWQWLAITGGKYKEEYKPSQLWEFECACCEYVYLKQVEPGYGTTADGYAPDCSAICPLTGYAWGDDGCCPPLGNNEGCSLYEDWENFSDGDEDRKAKSLRMVYSCNQAIEDMIINGEA